LRDYLYIGLGGNRRGRARTARNLLATMLLGGLWHGAGWTFILWGAIHGVGLVVERRIAERWPSDETGRVGRLLRSLVTFHLVCAAWVFFRSVDVERALEVFSALGGSWTSVPGLSVGVVLLLLLGLLTQVVAPGRLDGLWVKAGRLPLVVQAAGITMAILSFDALGPDGVAPFIYFAF
jgi:D-alanyl-lipoteichoic acid acyltransferase DltB (MBOAT superfamily)